MLLGGYLVNKYTLDAVAFFSNFQKTSYVSWAYSVLVTNEITPEMLWNFNPKGVSLFGQPGTQLNIELRGSYFLGTFGFLPDHCDGQLDPCVQQMTMISFAVCGGIAAAFVALAFLCLTICVVEKR